MAITETTSLNAILNETGKVYLSVDGYGTLSQTGFVEVLKKPDATVRKAYLVGSGTNISSSVIGNIVTLNGTNVNWNRIESTPWDGGNSFYSYLADVTSVLKPSIDSAASGTLSIALDEGNETYSYEGLALAVLFDDPNQTTDNNVILYFGGLPTTGATTTINFSSPVDLNQVGAATLGLGIGFSYAAGGQTSQVSVNGQQLSLVAGDYDDGVSGPNNGSLFTVGGLGDNTNNPPLLSTDPATDDELYNLLPFINNGDSSLTLNTINPSNDDHIFFAHLTLEGLQSTTISSVISFSSSAYQLQEDGSDISTVTLTRSGSVIGEVSVTLTPTDGTAVAGNHYDGTPIVVNFADGQARAIVAIPIIDNEVYEGNKTINLALSNATGGAILGSQNTSTVTIIDDEPQPIYKYTFTYFYGNGDSYSGYGFAPSGTYSVGQLPNYYDNETGNQQGYYVINSVEAGETGANGYVYLTSYTDADTGFGTTTNIYYGSPSTYYGLGNEGGYAFNDQPWTGDYYFNRYYEADLPAVLQVRVNLLADNNGTPGDILTNDQVGLNRSFFAQIQVGDLRGNAAGVVGLDLDFGWDGLILESINFDPSLAINPNFPLFQDGSLVSDGLIKNLSGGSLPQFDFGQAIGVNKLDTFALLRFSTENTSGTTYFTTKVNQASLADDNAYYSLDVETSQPVQVLVPYSQYNFTYHYGNGDSYSGYVYAVEGTYTVGQTLEGYSNETGKLGYYKIESIASTTLDSSYNNRVYITSYTDGDTGYGKTTNVYSYGGGSGLGSEYGYAYDTNGNSSDPYFSNSAEADILGNQKYNFTYYYGNGDSYSGYGFAAVGTYTAGQIIGYYANENPGRTGSVETNTLGYEFYGDSVYRFTYTFTNASDLLTLNFKGSNLEGIYNESWGLDNVRVTAGGFTYSNDFETDALEGWSSSTRSTTPVGSRNFLGEFANDTVSLSLNNTDLANNPITLEFDLFILKSWDGIGNLGSGPDYFALTTSSGQTLLNTTFANYPGQFQSYPSSNTGYYVINSVELGNTNAGYNGYVYLTSYNDTDTGFGTTTNLSNANPATYYGLGNEVGYAYDSNGNSSDAYFSNFWEADILNQYYTFTYTYGNGDSYAGYGYALAGTYTAGQILGGYSNETGNVGYYAINSVEAGTTNSSQNNRVYITSYTDGDTLHGKTTNLYSYGGGSGLGSEYGHAYTSSGSSLDALFGADGSGIHKEADLVGAGLSITDNSGNPNDSSIKFTTRFPLRQNYAESDLVRPNFADTTKYFDITNTGTGILQVSDIVSNVAGVTTNFVDDLLINPGESQRIQLSYDPSAAGENFSVADGLVLFTNDLNLPQYAIALNGKSTFNSDINYDGKVGAGDLGPLNNASKNFNNGIYDPTADIDGNGLIEKADLMVLLSENKLSLV